MQLPGGNPIFNFDCAGRGRLKFFTEFERRSGGNPESLKMLQQKGTSGNSTAIEADSQQTFVLSHLKKAGAVFFFFFPIFKLELEY